ncbi:hypothetical protein AB0378_004256 [Salmonella enterica]
MKKTLISLAVAASAIASGSAMAWQANGRGGTVELSGTLTPVELVTPWEVKMGDAVSGLNTQIKKGQKETVIPVKHPIPVLGIRTRDKVGFHGDVGIAPQIDFHGNADFEHSTASLATLSLEVKDKKKGAKIGTMTTNILAGSIVSSSASGSGFVVAPKPGQAFYGGIAPSIDGSQTRGVISGLQHIFGHELVANFSDQGGGPHGPASETFTNKQATYSAYYGAGIDAGQSIKISLDRRVEGDEPIEWHASLPVTVSYQ